MIPHEFSEDEHERRMLQAESHVNWCIADKELAKAGLLQQVAALENDLETQEVPAPARVFLAEQLGEQPALMPIAEHSEVNNTVSTARRFVTAAPKAWLRRWKIAAWIGVVLMAAVDILAAWHVTGQMAVNQYNVSAVSIFERGGLALLTLLGYWLIGVLYSWGGAWKRVAGGMYGLIVAMLTWGLAQTWLPKFQEIFGSVGSGFGGQSAHSLLVQVGAWLATIALAVVFSWAGLLFLVMKGWLLYWLDLDHAHDLCTGISNRAEQAEATRMDVQQLDADLQHFQHNRAALIAQFYQEGVRHDQQVIQQHLDTAVTALNDVRTATSVRRSAESIRLICERSLHSLQTIVPCLLLGAALPGLAGCTQANSAQEMEAQAPTMQILADCSTSSPVYEKTFVDSVMRSVIAPRLMALPLASRVLVTGIGDNTQTPISYDGRVQAVNNASGGTRAQMVKDVHRLLQSVPAATKYGRSELMVAFAEAAKKINPGASQLNSIIALSDLMEESSMASCHTKAKHFCKLPSPSFKYANTELVVLGVAVGLDARKALALNEAWKGWFLKTGLDQTHLALRRD